MKYLLILILVTTFLSAGATEKPIEGVVRDAATNAPLPFTNIVVMGKHRGTVSNSEGHYLIDKREIDKNDAIVFSYVGYKVVNIKVSELLNDANIYLQPAAVNLKAVQISNRPLSAHEIVKRVQKSFEKNYSISTTRQDNFFHKYERVPFPKENQIHVKRSDFIGLDKQVVEELLDIMPKEFIEYQDAVVDLYSNGEEHKLIPVAAISLEEGSMQELGKEFENKLGAFFDDLQVSKKDDDVYYKMRSGVISHKIKPNKTKDSLWKEYKNDTLNYTVETSLVKDDILHLLKDYTTLKSKNWEFIHDRSKYNYTKDDVTVLNDEMVYKITFIPKDRGKFEGTAYISTTTFAVLQLDFAFADDKQSEKFQVLGFGHSMNYKGGRVIFEKGEKAYFAKYIYAHQEESASVDRNFSIMKKQKRHLADKELNEIKLEVQMNFNIESYWEMLVLEREEINSDQFEKAEQALLMKFRKEYAYNPYMWSNRTVIVPTSDLKKYTRK